MSKIKLTHNDKTYTLEYTRRSARIIEEQGFKLDEIGNAPNKMIPLLWQGAFVKNHQGLKPKKLDEIYKAQTNKSDLIEALATLYADTIKSLIGDEDEEEETDEKNATWELV